MFELLAHTSKGQLNKATKYYSRCNVMKQYLRIYVPASLRFPAAGGHTAYAPL